VFVLHVERKNKFLSLFISKIAVIVVDIQSGKREKT
jgi:hypothetical protein